MPGAACCVAQEKRQLRSQLRCQCSKLSIAYAEPAFMIFMI
jgi:hypothetical protein